MAPQSDREVPQTTLLQGAVRISEQKHIGRGHGNTRVARCGNAGGVLPVKA
jgi:hypothetical protein